MACFKVIGDPIAHSLSPLLHDTVYKRYGLSHRYEKEHVLLADLEAFVAKCREEKTAGFNITVPHKKSIMPFLDEISPEAALIGAVNTVKLAGDRLIGYNTDGPGFARQLEADGFTVRGAAVAMLGAGGSAAAILWAVLNSGAASVTVYNRTVERAQALVENFPGAKAKPLSEFSAVGYDLLINTTSAGLSGDASPVPSLDGISPKAAVYDLIYDPPETALLRMAREQGCRTANGYDLLIWQGLLADEIWLDIPFAKDLELVDEIRGKLKKCR